VSACEKDTAGLMVHDCLRAQCSPGVDIDVDLRLRQVTVTRFPLYRKHRISPLTPGQNCLREPPVQLPTRGKVLEV